MRITKNYAVFGLGRYGFSVAMELEKCGAEVLAVDADPRIVSDVASLLPMCKCADVTDADVIQQLGIATMDAVIIAMANSLEASVLATMLCKEVGVPTVIVKCANKMHQRILTKVGADQVVFPEYESGVRLAKNLLSNGFMDIMELSSEASMLELDVRPEWVGKNLLELNLRKKYSMNIVAIRDGKNVSTVVDPVMPMQAHWKLIVIANPSRLQKLKS